LILQALLLLLPDQQQCTGERTRVAATPTLSFTFLTPPLHLPSAPGPLPALLPAPLLALDLGLPDAISGSTRGACRVLLTGVPPGESPTQWVPSATGSGNEKLLAPMLLPLLLNDMKAPLRL
jgi:hypothetical protein